VEMRFIAATTDLQKSGWSQVPRHEPRSGQRARV
jgi:hypothetical protein